MCCFDDESKSLYINDVNRWEEKVRVLDFSKKAVLVTGASSGIGFAVAHGFAKCGADLTILAQDQGIYEAADRISVDTGRKVTPLLCNIADRDEVSNSFSTVSNIDVLVNNAGIERVTPLEQTGSDIEEAFNAVVDVNLLGTYFVTREAIGLMPDGAKIVFTASTWSRTACAQMSGYCASKHAVLGFARSLAYELGPRRINVNCICPGWVRTDQSFRSVLEMAKNTGQSFEDASAELLGKQAIGGMLEPEDMVDGYLFLSSELARDITGQSLHVDRGEVMS